MKTNDKCNVAGPVVEYSQMSLSSRKLRDTYEIKKDAPFYQTTCGLWVCLDSWYKQGLERDTDINTLFMFDEPGFHCIEGLGWCEAAFYPTFENKIIEDRGG